MAAADLSERETYDFWVQYSLGAKLQLSSFVNRSFK